MRLADQSHILSTIRPYNITDLFIIAIYCYLLRSIVNMFEVWNAKCYLI